MTRSSGQPWVADLAAPHLLRVAKLDDGEVVIVCRRGFICEWQPPERLAWCVTYPAVSNPTAHLKSAARQDPKLRIEVEGDEEFIASFAVEDLRHVASRWARARRQRRLSDEAKLRLATTGAASRFSSGTAHRAAKQARVASERAGETGKTCGASEVARGRPGE